MAAAARQKLLAEFTADVMVEGNVRVYDQLLDGQTAADE